MVVESIVKVVQSLDEEDEQSSGNLLILTEVYSQIEDLVLSGKINVTEDVRINPVHSYYKKLLSLLWPLLYS